MKQESTVLDRDETGIVEKNKESTYSGLLSKYFTDFLFGIYLLINSSKFFILNLFCKLYTGYF